MLNKIICLFMGHKKYSPKVLDDNDIIWVSDSPGTKLVSINVCKRCGAVYSNLKKR